LPADAGNAEQYSAISCLVGVVVGIMIRMTAMNDTYASTCALTIPVLALAGFIEARVAFGLLGPGIRGWRRYWFLRGTYISTLTSIIILCAGWMVLMWYSVWSEDACLNYMLTHDQAQGNAAAAPVKYTLLWLLVMLILFPLLGLIVGMIVEGGPEEIDKLRKSAERRRDARSRLGRSSGLAAHGTGSDPSNYLG
jgi:hypothetical protein